MKKFLAVILISFCCSLVCEAKYVYPKGSTTTTERKVNRRMRNYDKDGVDGLSLEEYQEYRKMRTYYERQLERRSRNDGVYTSPEDSFKAMDVDGDGIVSRDEMLSYERKRQQQKK